MKAAKKNGKPPAKAKPLEIQIVDLADLKEAPTNARKRTERSAFMIQNSLQEYGAGRSLLVDENLQLMAGHGVREEAMQLGFKRVKVVETDGETLVAVMRPGLTEEQKAGMRLVDNRAAELSIYDYPKLLEEGDIVPLDKFFFENELEVLKGLDNTTQFADAKEPEDSEDLIDNAEELNKKWKVSLGQVWDIPSERCVGKNHRLMCGDCTDSASVRILMSGAKAGLMNTDPPYGVGYANDERPNPGVAKPRVANDTFKDDALQSFLESCFRVAVTDALIENAAWYLWHAHLTQGFFAAAAAAAHVILHRQIIWVKPVLLLGRGHYHWKHEPYFFGWVQGHEPPDYGLGNGERTQTTIWEVDSVSHADREEFNHSTPKPIGLFTVPIIKHLKRGEICYEPFAGSGPQFVAAENTGRLAYGLELEPRFCAVILQRMEGLGLEPKLCETVKAEV